MAFNIPEYLSMFKYSSTYEDHAGRAHSVVSATSSTGSNKRQVKLYLEARQEAYRKEKKSENLQLVDVTNKEFQERHPWFNKFNVQKNIVVCDGRMKLLTYLMTEFPDLMDEKQKTTTVAHLLQGILSYMQMQKYIIVTYVDPKPDLVLYSGCLTQILATYFNMNIVIHRRMDLTNLTNRKLYKRRAMSWMTHIAFHCDFSLDWICEAILKTKGITDSPPEITGELVIGYWLSQTNFCFTVH